MDNRVDLAGALALVAAGVAVIVLALTYPTPAVEFDAIGPMGFPLVLGAGLVVGGTLQAFRCARALRRFGAVGPAEGTEDEPEHPASTKRAMGFLAGSFVYLLALAQLGYFVSTVPAIALALWAMDYRRPLPLAAVSLGFAVVAYAAFYGVLAVPLPAGPIEQQLQPLFRILR